MLHSRGLVFVSGLFIALVPTVACVGGAPDVEDEAVGVRTEAMRTGEATAAHVSAVASGMRTGEGENAVTGTEAGDVKSLSDSMRAAEGETETGSGSAAEGETETGSGSAAEGETETGSGRGGTSGGGSGSGGGRGK